MSQFNFDKRTERVYSEQGDATVGRDRLYIQHGDGPMCFVELVPGSITESEARRLVDLLNQHDFQVDEPQ